MISFHQDAYQFLEKLEQRLRDYQIRIEPQWDVDHLCYRVSTEEKYETLKQDFLSFSKLLIESEVNGRLISTFKLNKPVIYKDWYINIVELPAPKSGKTTIEGFEHVEIVPDVPLSEIERRYNHLKLDLGGLKKWMNPELEILLGEINIKFHPLSLESLIRLEENAPVYSAIKKSKVLEYLKGTEPQIAGSFPLGIQTENSDVDIIFHLPMRIIPGFQWRRIKKENVDAMMAQFKVDGIPFELFGQQKPAVEQAAYRHFLIEERLLKLGGEKLNSKIQSLRSEGLKTEPAFAKALNLPGDPYEALLKLQKKSTPELLQLLNSI